MAKYKTTVELQKETMKFSAGHTTLFSATEREPLHGHMYTVYLALTAWVEENGMAFDYRQYKEHVHRLCRQLNQTFLMPQYSTFLTYAEDEEYYYFTFNHKKMIFLKEDITLLPVTNITIEELARWFVESLAADKESLTACNIDQIVVKVSSAPGQSASYVWCRE